MANLYHFLAYSLSPLLLFLVWALIATAVAWRKRDRIKKRHLLGIVIPLSLLFVIAPPPASYLALGSLEWHYQYHPERPTPCPVLVVLSAGLLPPGQNGPDATLSPDTIVRCLHATRLYHRGPPCPILVSGGKPRADMPGPTLAVAMQEFLIATGIPDENVWLEETSRDTYENAERCATLLAERGIDQVVLVTQAVHMLRAEACFRKVGLKVIPAPCAFLTTSAPTRLPDALLPSMEPLRGLQTAFHEWLGLTWYWLRGRI